MRVAACTSWGVRVSWLAFAFGVAACETKAEPVADDDAIANDEALQPVAIGQEVAVPRHLQDGEEFTTPLAKLLAHGQLLFTANWTIQEGGGRPLTKNTGTPVTDPTSPLI